MRPVRRIVLVVAALAASTLSCGRELTGPNARGRVSGPLAFAPEFPAALRAAGGSISDIVEFEKVRIVFRRSDGVAALDRTVDFPATADSLALTLSVPISPGAPESGETVALSLFYVDATDDTVFTGGPVPVDLVPARAGEPPPPPIGVTLRYTGPGEEAVRVVLSPASASLVAGQTQAFTTQAFDEFNTAVTAPVLFESTDTSIVQVSETGVATARNRRASAFVIARLYSGEADTSSVSVTLPASAIAASGGSGQSGAAGTTLAQNVAVLVTASDGVPVPGVAVSFAASSGGAPGAPTVLTDANGLAGTSWTLGNAVGAQTMTASAAGLTGSPVTFTATATPAVPASLTFTSQPTAVTAGAAIAPAVVVEARTTSGTLAVGYTDSVTIALGSNPGSATLGGTRTVAAVNGVATFAGLTLDRVGTGYTLVASSGALTGATSAAFTVTAGAATALTFAVQPAGGTPGLALAPAPVVRAVDAFGNLTAFAGNVTLTIGANPGGATLGGTATRAAVANAATFDDLTLSATGTGYTLVAASAGLTSATSVPFNIGAQTISWVNTGGGNWSVAANWNLNRVPEASDVVEIALNGTYTVNLDVNANVAGIQLGASASGVQTLQLVSRTLTLAGDVGVGANGVLFVSASTVNGTGNVVNDGTVALSNATLALTLDNRALTRVSGVSALNGAVLNPVGATLRVAQADGCCGTATLTVANGFTNAGTIELSNAFVSAYGAQFTVAAGTLVNAAGATIASVGGQSPGGARGISAQLDNQGTLTVAVPLSLNRASAVHQNSGLIDLSGGDFVLTQSGAGASFTNTGSVVIPAGRTMTVQGGSLALAAGAVSGPGALTLQNLTASFATPVSNAVTTLNVAGTTINGPGTLTVSSGRALTLFSSTVNAPLVNEGTLVVSGVNAINGTFANTAGATLRVAQLDGCCGTATLTVANGFTNLGLIELTNQFVSAYGAQLNVTAGTLVNAPTATIAVLGGQTPGGGRVLGAQLDNQGTLSLGVPLTLSRANSAHVNSGLIDVTVADLSISQSGSPASFTNTGTMTLGTGRTITVSAGSFIQAAGTLGGPGTLTLLNLTASFATPLSNAVTQLTVAGTTINGPGTLTNESGRTLTLYSSTVNAPLVNQGTLTVSGVTVINGALTQQGTLNISQLDGCCGTATLTVANGFTNEGALVLTNGFVSAYGALLNVTNGTLVNAAAATISAVGGQTPGGGRTLAAQLDNQGTLVVAVPLTISRASSAHVNSGLIDASGGDLAIGQSGAGASFTNTGSLAVGAGRTLTLTGGLFNQSAGTFAGNGTVVLSNTTITFATPFSNATTQLNVFGSTINGTAAVTNATGRTLTLFSSTVNAPLVNEGLLVTSGVTTIGGTFSNVPGATLRVAQLDGCCGTATLSFANGFTNQGLIELSNAFVSAYGAQINVNAGQLVNAASGTITALGGQTPGGARLLAAELVNDGTLSAEVPFALNRPNSNHVNNGLVSLTTGSLSISQSGAASFTNAGTFALGAGSTFAVTGGSFTSTSGATIGGAGSLSLQGVTSAFNGATPTVGTIALTAGQATFASPMTTASTAWALNGTTLVGAGPFTNAPGTTQVVTGTIFQTPVVNQGTLHFTGASTMPGGLTTATGSVLRIGQLDGSVSMAHLTVSGGLTNNGELELTNGFPVAYSSQLTVNGGPLVNSPSGTIRALPGTLGGGQRTLIAVLDNQGVVALQAPLVLSLPSAQHTNSGTVDLIGGNLVLTQSGTSPSFSNTGTILVGAGRAMQVSAGTFVNQPGATISGNAMTFSGATAVFNGATPALTSYSIVAGSSVSFQNAITTAGVGWSLSNSTLNGASTFTNVAGQTLTLNQMVINLPLVNEGTLVASGATTINGALTTVAGSQIRIGQIDGTTSLANLTVANGFANNGTIELTNAFPVAYSSRLGVNSGELLNTASGSIVSSSGTLGGGTRTIQVAGNLTNQGTVTVHPGEAGTLAITTASFNTSGTINVELGGTVAGTGYDRLAITGLVNLTGTLNAALINGFTVSAGNTFLVLTSSGALAGTFSSFTPPAGISGTPTYGAGGVTLVTP